MRKLCEIGEHDIVRNIIYNVFPELSLGHDDAVIVNLWEDKNILVSTDPCPDPIVCKFDYKNKYYHFGRMSVLINYSDMSAMGAVPIGILLSTIMRNDMLEEEYKQFLVGVKDACAEWGGKLLGGNIKEGDKFSVTGTSIGQADSGRLMTRKGCNVGDKVCIVGDLGLFWLSIFKLMNGVDFDDLDDYTKSFLIKPFPKIKEGIILANSKKATACMDSSDGVIGCFYELSEINDVTICIQNEQLIPNQLLEDYCLSNKIDYRNLMLSWGGWELVFTCSSSEVADLENEFLKRNSSFQVVGEIIKKGSFPVILQAGEKMFSINDFSSKRFDSSSYITYGLEAYISQLLDKQINELN